MKLQTRNLTHILTSLLLVLCAVSTTAAQDTGVLILAHGGSEEWNDLIHEAAEPLKANHKVEVAFGMANYVSMHHGLKALEEQGVSKIAVVQLFISSYSPIIEQNAYLLGKRDSLPETPMPLMHHVDEYKEMMGIEEEETAGHHGGGHRFYMPKNLQPIPLEAEVVLTPALDDHPVVAEILNKRIQELSSDPANETVLMVAHGPNSEENNKKWIDTMESLSQKIQSTQADNGTPYKQIFALTVRDDAPEPVFEQAKANLRTLVRQAGQNGEVIVVPLFLSSGGREQAVAQRLEGLDFEWSGKTLLPDPLITDFIQKSVKAGFAEMN
ncbi:sirohydrochlorin chelatase [Gracilimonas mengyeensis]|uniref:CbiX protein n=1 Tax=Gracilimonas mengyeensis TaxID=1302730 RepID=A0A521FK15_9BACT|nr:CbiX/SirB N-terminal domain-containing protein [Gracilimonas mengyeensis]SMO96538.1 CbiX protein [Gracilimonas mengyeensis]